MLEHHFAARFFKLFCMKPEDFLDAVRSTAERHGMDLGSPLALVSGGPDSVALLRALVGLGGEPAVLHVDHGLRGEESREDAEFVLELCRKLGVRCEVRRLRLEDGPNLQERARDERYRLARSEEHTSELQSRQYLVCRLLLEKKQKPLQTSIIRLIHPITSLH